MGSSETSESSAETPDSEEIPTYSLTSGVTEVYLNWDGSSGNGGGGGISLGWLKTVGSILLVVVVGAIIIGAIAAVLFVGFKFVQKRKKGKKVEGGTDYVLVEGD